MKNLVNILLALTISISVNAKEIREFMDLQAHATMSAPYGFFGNSLTWSPNFNPKVSHKHRFKNVIHPEYLEANKGSRIIINGAMAAEVGFTKKKAKILILKQIKMVDDFVAKNSDKFAVARSPEEVRDLVHNTDKTIFIHSIEGARKLIGSASDAKFWASKGVAYITLIHLLDDEFGGSAFNPGFLDRIINMRGSMRRLFHPRRNRGLTSLGKRSIKWIADAGMLVDLTHMSPDSKLDALKIMQEQDIPPLLTHSMYKPIQNHDRGITKEELIKVYELGGLFSLPISGSALFPHRSETEYLNLWNDTKGCLGSSDSYRFTFNIVENEINKNLSSIFKLPENTNYSDLTDEEKTQVSIGWQSDFNGWTNHSRPRYGKAGCFKIPEGKKLSKIETVGLAHPGLLPEYWGILEADNMNIDSLKRASERFLQLWEKVRKRN